jgi:hypothetical protein
MIKQFFESPANRAGLSAWAATALTALVQVLVTRTLPPAADLLGLVIGLLAIVQPDNSVTRAQLEKAVADVQAMLHSKTPANVESVVADAAGLVAGVTTPKAQS